MGTNAPIPESELRERVRMIADGVLIDASLTFVALMREQGITGSEYGPIIIDEWSSALLELSQESRSQLEDFRLAGSALAALVTTNDAEIDETLEALIEHRRAAIRDARDAEEADDELEERPEDCAICGGPCTGDHADA